MKHTLRLLVGLACGMIVGIGTLAPLLLVRGAHAPQGGCGPACYWSATIRFPGPATVELRAAVEGRGFVTFTAADLGDPIYVDSPGWQTLAVPISAQWGSQSAIRTTINLQADAGAVLTMDSPNVWLLPVDSPATAPALAFPLWVPSPAVVWTAGKAVDH